MMRLFLIFIGWSPRPWVRCECDYVTATLPEIRERERLESLGTSPGNCCQKTIDKI